MIIKRDSDRSIEWN